METFADRFVFVCVCFVSIVLLVVETESKRCHHHRKCHRCPSKCESYPLEDPCDSFKCSGNTTCTIGCPFAYCPPRCEDLNPLCQSNACIRAEPFCACKKGYVIGPDGNCIRENDCPYNPCAATSCLANTTCIVGCAPCMASCEDRNPICTEECRDFGAHCKCADGYLLHKGECILEKDCPPTPLTCETADCSSKPNNTCIMICPFSYCPPRCDDRNPACDKKLCKRAEPICVCADGYIIGPNGDCISERQCPNCSKPGAACAWDQECCGVNVCCGPPVSPSDEGRKVGNCKIGCQIGGPRPQPPHL